MITEIAPEHSDALLQRGRAFSQSRGICGAHWESDIVYGRLIGAATVARLRANPVFTAQIQAAGLEVSQARTRGATSAGDCAWEKAALEASLLMAP